MLANTVFNTSRGMILGNSKSNSGAFNEEDDEDIMFKDDLSQLDMQENQRREAGWIIFEGLIHLGN